MSRTRDIEIAQAQYLALIQANSRIRFLEAILKRITEIPIPELDTDGVDQAAWSMQLLAQEALKYPKGIVMTWEQEYAYLRNDKQGALEQIYGELQTALDLDMVSGSAKTLCEGLKVKAELGLGIR